MSGLNKHSWRCSQNPEASYTRSHITTQIRQGLINPHDRDSCHAFINQVFSHPAIDEQGLEASNNYDDDEESDHNPNGGFDLEDDSATHSNNVPNLYPTLQGLDDDEDMDYIVDSNLPVMYAESLLHYAECRNKFPASESSNHESVEYDNHLPVNLTCWAHLLFIVNENGGSAKLFNSIVKFITKWNEKYPRIFNTIGGQSQVFSRKTVIEKLETAFKTKCLKPENLEVTLPSNGRKVTVPVPDFAAMTRYHLSKDYVMANISPNLDRDTFRPKVDQDTHENDGDALIGEKDSGWMYREAIKHHCPNNVDPTLVRPYPIVLHTDYTHADTNGFLRGCPLQGMPAMLTNQAQSDSKCWMLLAIIPSLSTGKGKKKNKRNGLLNSQDYHVVLKAALSSMKKYMDNGGFHWTDPDGRVVLLKPYVLVNLGDSAGHNENVAKKQHSTHPVRECMCTFNQLTQLPPPCQPLTYKDVANVNNSSELFNMAESNNLITLQNLSHALTNKEYAHSISYYSGVKVAWNDLLLADIHTGIVGMSPYDIIHSVQGGTHKYTTQAHKDIIGPRETNASLKSDIEALMHDIKFMVGRNSERDLLPMSTRNGYFSCTNLSCEEVEGNNFGYLILLHSTYGYNVLRPCYEEAGIDYDDALETYKLLHSWERFYMDVNKRKMIEKSAYATVRLMKRIMDHIPREVRKRSGCTPGSYGWHIVKFHAMWMMSFYVLKFGSARGFDTANNEKNHKRLFKEHIDRTQKQAGKFAKQVASNEYIRLTVNVAHEQMSRYYPTEISSLGVRDIEKSKSDHTYIEFEEECDYTCVSEDEEEEDYQHDKDRKSPASTLDNAYFNGRITDLKNVRGSFSLDITMDHRGRRTVTREWTWKAKEDAGQRTNPIVEVAIADYHKKYCELYEQPYDGSIEVQCFTSANIDGIVYHFDEDYRGQPWYDWANVHFPETIDAENGIDCAACIMGVFYYKTKSAPTFNRVEIDGMDWDDIVLSPTPDTTMYMVIHCSENEMHFRDIRKEFILPFKVTTLEEIYILPVDMINGPMLVVPDVVDENHTSSRRFYAVTPKRHQGAYFRRYINTEDPGYEVDMDEPTRFDCESEGSDYDSNEDDRSGSNYTDDEDSNNYESDDYSILYSEEETECEPRRSI